jgi:DNA replication protein DnaC
MTTEIPDSAFSLHSLDRLLEIVRARSIAFEQEIDAAPAAMPCGIHGGMLNALNREASWQAGKLVYVCATCEHEAFLERCKKRVIAAGIPADVRHATLSNFLIERNHVKEGKGYAHPSTFLEKTSIFAAGGLRNLILAGTPGIGKGHLAAAVAIQYIVKGKSVSWAECARLFADYHRAYKTDTTEAIVRTYATAALLVLDEICLTDLPKDGEEILFAILDRRHKNGLPSILLGNAIATEVKKWLGSRIVDRLRSGGVALCYGEWDSMRGTDDDEASNF